MDPIYLYLELVALAILAWLWRGKFKSFIARRRVDKDDARSANEPSVTSRS